MLKKQFDFLIFIGRLQPFHLGHYKIVQKALELADNVVILCGSANSPRTIRNPWTVEEREEMIRRCFTLFDNNRIIIKGLDDVLYNDKLWIEITVKKVKSIIDSFSENNEFKIGLIGHEKDHSSYYLKLFPDWQYIAIENEKNISSTPIREEFLNNQNLSTSSIEKLHESVYSYLLEFSSLPYYKSLVEEAEFVNQYKQAWDKAPYLPIFITVAAAIVKHDHVLFIRRQNIPGKGLIELPGDFVNSNEKLFEECIRILKEKANLDLSSNKLKDYVRSARIFDEPQRSSLGRVITYVFYFELPNDPDSNHFINNNAGKEISWYPLNKLNPTEIYDDHYHIIRNILKIL
ncbi:MAG: bifunctional nicotinamide-nucleotide adenylyltransferase/Nudix hydroxylase [Alphaproteobacteria bacterium]